MAGATSSEDKQATLPIEDAKPRVRAKGFNHLHINVRDLDRSVRFYRQAFGLRESFRDGKIIFMVPQGSRDSLALHQGEPIGMSGVQHFGFSLSIDDLDRAIEQVEKAGGRLVSRGKHGGHFPYAYVSDPDGYVIEL